MYIRCAYFEGRVREGRDAEFRDYVRQRLVPLWTRFPGAELVQVWHQAESDTAEPHYAMVLAIRYPSREAIERALASPVRGESREVTQGLLPMFDGRIFHTVFEASEYPTQG